MAAEIAKTDRKITLDLKEGTQTISPLVSGATDEAIYNTGCAIADLIGSELQCVLLVETQKIEDNE